MGEHEFERIDGRWVLRKLFLRDGIYYGHVRDSRTGRVYWRSTREGNRRRALDEMRKFVKELKAREEMKPLPGVKFSKLFGEWLDLKDCREVTLAGYRNDFEAIYKPEFGRRLVHEIDGANIQKFMKKLKDVREATERTRQKHLGCLRSFFSWCQLVKKLRRDNPCEGIKVGRVEKHIATVLSLEQMRKLLAKAREKIVHEISDKRRHRGKQTFGPPPHLHIALMLVAYTGLRRKNLLTVRWDNLQFGEHRLFIPAVEMKGRADHEMPIHPVLAGYLEDVLRDREKKEGKVSPKDPVIGRDLKEITKGLQSVCDRAKVPAVGWHEIRHSFASWLMPKCPFPVLRALLGHSPGSIMTLKYSHPSWEDLDKAINTLPDLLTPAPVAEESVHEQA